MKYPIVLLLTSLSVYGQAMPDQPPAENSAESKIFKRPPQPDDLDVANPFFSPYHREVQMNFVFAKVENKVRTDFPLVTGTPYRQVEMRTYQASAAFSYGFHDRLALGLGTDFYVLDAFSDNKSLTPAASLAPGEGLTGLELTLLGRMAGIKKNQFYADFTAKIRPGLLSSDSNSYGAGRTAATLALTTGANYKFLTIGLAGHIDAATDITDMKGKATPSNPIVLTNIPGYTFVTGQAIAQIDWLFFYGRAAFSYSKYIDAVYSQDSATRYTILSYSGTGGIKIGTNVALELTYQLVPQIKGDLIRTTQGNMVHVTLGEATQISGRLSVKF